jgi:serine/threonine protein kinase
VVRSGDYRQSVRASPKGVKNLRSQYQTGVGSPKPAPRKAAPKPPPKKTVGGPPKHKELPRPNEDEAERLRLQEEEELAAFEAQETARKLKEAKLREEKRKQEAAEAKRRKEAEERKKQEELERRKKKEEEERRKQEAERQRLEEESRLRIEQQRASKGNKRAVEVLVAVADYEGNSSEGELTFNEGDFILMMKRDATGWWQGDLAGQVGWFPSNFTEETTVEEYESYCAEWGIAPYFEPEPVVVARAKPKPKVPPTKSRTNSRTPAVSTPAAAATPASPEMSREKCAHCKALFRVKELEGVAKVADMKIHPKCMTPFRKAQGDLKKLEFGTLPNSMEEFEIQGLLGKGRFGKVYQCLKLDNGKIYAIKALLKSHIESSDAQKILVEREKSILQKINGPFLVRCYHIFEDDEKLYFVMECASGGELFVHLSRERIFDPDRVRFYAAEIFLGLEYLHNMGIVYRDLKPENVLLTAEGHILMTDFGISKEGLDDNDQRTATFCGTPEYLAPEVLLGQGYGKAVDYWSYGSVVYEMLTGLPPYYSDDITEMYKKILQAPLEIPKECDKASRDFLIGLLDRNPDKRLQDHKKIRKHPYFRGIDWDQMFNMLVNAPYIPPEEFVYDDDEEEGGDGDDDEFADFDYDENEEELDYDPEDGLLRCKSNHDWDGEADGDLDLRVGDVIVITDNESDPEGWWEGELNGQAGMFPSNLVTLL